MSRAMPGTCVPGVVLTGGTLASGPGVRGSASSTAGSGFLRGLLVVGTVRGRGTWGRGTLLGPEGTAGDGWDFGRIGPALHRTVRLCAGQAVGRGWGRPFFENCTVDASIFVVKLVRAHGGCLGTRSR